MDVPLHSEIEQIITRQMQSGRYPTAADVIREAVLLLDETERLAHAGLRPGAKDQPRRSPRGILADIRSSISADEITAARGELWASVSDDPI